MSNIKKLRQELAEMAQSETANDPTPEVPNPNRPICYIEAAFFEKAEPIINVQGDFALANTLLDYIKQSLVGSLANHIEYLRKQNAPESPQEAGEKDDQIS